MPCLAATRGHALLAAFAVLAATPAAARDGRWDVRAEVRARMEAVDGQFRPEPVAERDAALMLRTLVGVEYAAERWRIGAELQDSRALFERPRSSVSTSEVNALEPLQAYLAVRPLGGAELLAGRFTLDLGSRRFVARNSFRNTINGFTGVRASLGDKERGVELFWTSPQRRLPDDPAGVRDDEVALDREFAGQRFWGAFARAETAAGRVEAYLYRLAERDRPGFATRDRRLWTSGARLLKAPAKGKLDVEIETAWQWGRTRAGTSAADRDDLPVSAGYAHLAAGRTFDTAWTPRLGLALDLASGDGRGRRFTRFDTLFGARYWEFGPTGLMGAVQRANLVSAEARLEVRPDEPTDAYLAVRPLRLASRTDAFAATGVRDPEGDAGRHAGTQIDARVRRWLVPRRVRGVVGYTRLQKGRFLRDAANAPPGNATDYAFTEVTLSF